MKNSIFGLLISLLLVQGSKAMSVLDPAEELQSQVDDFKNETGSLTELKNHEKVTQEMLDAHDKSIETRMTELDSNIKGNEKFIAKFQNFEDQLEMIEGLQASVAQFEINEQLAKIKSELQEAKWQKQIDNITSRIESMAKSDSIDILQNKFTTLQSTLDTELSNTLKQSKNISVQVQDQIEENNEMIKTLLNDITPMNRYKQIGSKYYYIEEAEYLNWFQAAHKCLSLGGHLASIKNLKEFKAIRAALKPDSHYWLDFNDLGTEGVYLSIATGLPVNFFKWHADNPGANNDEHCGELWFYDDKHLMNDSNCYDEEFFICEPYYQ